MEKTVKFGDLVESTRGRDKNKIFLVVEVDQTRAIVVDGRTHKMQKPKSKNVKHLKKVSTLGLKDLALRIQTGQSVGNEKVYRSIKTEKEKIQED